MKFLRKAVDKSRKNTEINKRKFLARTLFS